MTKHTKRDRVWNAALNLGWNRDVFALSDVMDAADLPSESERTARDVLTTMAEMGVLTAVSGSDGAITRLTVRRWTFGTFWK